MNRLYAYVSVCVFLFVICIALYGISEVLRTYQFEESKNNEWAQPTEDNVPDPYQKYDVDEGIGGKDFGGGRRHGGYGY